MTHSSQSTTIQEMEKNIITRYDNFHLIGDTTNRRRKKKEKKKIEADVGGGDNDRVVRVKVTAQ